MKIRLTILISYCLLVAGIAYYYFDYCWVTDGYNDKYPWWEDYADYQLATDWKRLLKEIKASEDGCVVAKYQPGAKIVNNRIEIDNDNVTRQITWCIDNNTLYRFDTGLWGIPISFHSWNNIHDINKRYEIAKLFPNGPYSFLLPKKRKKRFAMNYVKINEFKQALRNAIFWTESGDFLRQIIKWTQPVRVQINDFSDGNVSIYGKTLTQRAEQFLIQIKQLTQVDIRPIQPGEIPNHQVFFYDRHDPTHRQRLLKIFEQALVDNDYPDQDIADKLSALAEFHQGKNTLCAVKMFFDVDMARERISMQHNVVLIFLEHRDNPDQLIECIHEEITQSMGITNDERRTEPTIFNDYSPYNYMTQLDQMMLAALYDPLLEHGMSPYKVSQQLDQVVERLRQRYPHWFWHNVANYYTTSVMKIVYSF